MKNVLEPFAFAGLSLLQQQKMLWLFFSTLLSGVYFGVTCSIVPNGVGVTVFSIELLALLWFLDRAAKPPWSEIVFKFELKDLSNMADFTRE